MKKKELLINVISVLTFIIFILINNYLIVELISKIIFLSTVFITFIVFSIFKLRSIKECIFSIDFLFVILFWCYSIIGPIVFSIDGYKPRFYYFTFNKNTMEQCLTLYTNILCIYIILCFLFNRIKKYDLKIFFDKLKPKVDVLNSKITFFDLLAIVFTLIVLFSIFEYGIDFFYLAVRLKRVVLNNGIKHYMNIYMLIYSLFMSLSLLLFKKENKNTYFYIRIICLIMYWGIFLTCERSVFVMFLAGFFVLYIINIKKLKLKYILMVVLIFGFFLFIAALRDGIVRENQKWQNVLYSSTTEYYCTFSVSNYYIYSNEEYRYGKTYVYDSISKLFPSFLLENKPIDLSQEFYLKHKLNVGFAFNPVAEGILNFGEKGAMIMVPGILFIITGMAHLLKNKNLLFYIIFYSFGIEFFRGAFSNFFFDIVFSCILIIIMFKLVYKRR